MASNFSFLLNLVMVLLLTTFTGIISSKIIPSHYVNLPTSTISASPTYFPQADSPLSSPPPSALSPDITPLFPTQGPASPSPSDSSLPTIPSSPSPPNPDSILAPQPQVAMTPGGAQPESFSFALTANWILNSAMFLGFLPFWLM